MILKKNQESAAQILAHKLCSTQIVGIEGLPGMGKSTVTKRIAELIGRRTVSSRNISLHDSADDSTLVTVDEKNDRRIYEELECLRKTTQKSVVLLSGIDPRFRENLVTFPTERLTPLNQEEVLAMAMSLDCNLPESNVRIIQTYSLGIPRLVERMSHQKPFSSNACKLFLSGYLANQNAVQRLQDDELDALIQRELQTNIPADIDRNLIAGRCYRDEWKSTLLRFVDKDLPYTVPLSAETVPNYEQWMENVRKEKVMTTSITVFAPDTGTNLKTLTEYLGTGKEYYATGVLGNRETHKTFWYHSGATYGGEGSAGGSNVMNMFLRISETGGYDQTGRKLRGERVAQREGIEPFLLYSCDHYGMWSQPLYAAYPTELALQHLGLEYFVSYSGICLQYNPASQTYRPITDEEIERGNVRR